MGMSKTVFRQNLWKERAQKSDEQVQQNQTMEGLKPAWSGQKNWGSYSDSYTEFSYITAIEMAKLFCHLK